MALDPPFVANFGGDQVVRFLQVTVQILTREPETVEILKANDPVMRNDLLMLFANQKYEVVAQREGKEKLRRTPSSRSGTSSKPTAASPTPSRTSISPAS